MPQALVVVRVPCMGHHSAGLLLADSVSVTFVWIAPRACPRTRCRPVRCIYDGAFAAAAVSMADTVRLLVALVV